MLQRAYSHTVPAIPTLTYCCGQSRLTETSPIIHGDGSKPKQVTQIPTQRVHGKLETLVMGMGLICQIEQAD